MGISNNVPHMRFSSFKDAWCIMRLDEVSAVERGKFTPRPRNDPKYYGGDIPFVQTGDVARADKFLTDYSQTLNQEGLAVSKKFPSNTILMSIAANIGDVALVTFSVACPDSLVGIGAKEKTHPSWLYYFLSTKKGELLTYATTNAQANINLEILRPLRVIIPSYKEQEKIASFLSSVDEKLNKLRRKRELLETYKRGVMQKIFSQELRFKKKGGGEFPDWQLLKLSEFLYEHKKRNYDLEFSKEDVLSVSGDMGVVNQIDHLGRSYAGKSVANYHVVHHGDIVYTKSPLKNNPYGIIKSNKGKAGIVSTLYAVYSCKDNAYSEYLDYYFSIDDNVNSYLRPLVHKGAKNDMKINNQRVLIDSINMPSYDEQKKIVEFLSSLDKKIDQVGRKIKQVDTFKKALLQKMFI